MTFWGATQVVRTRTTIEELDTMAKKKAKKATKKKATKKKAAKKKK
jgi:hypothetical protein